MHFHGAQSRLCVGVDIVFTSKQGRITSHSYILEFNTRNIIAKYDALLLGLELARDMGINLLVVVGDLDLVVKQVKNEFLVKNNRLK
jgi:ribonuclease HI